MRPTPLTWSSRPAIQPLAVHPADLDSRSAPEDSQRVRTCLVVLKDLDFGGRAGDPGYEQWKA